VTSYAPPFKQARSGSATSTRRLLSATTWRLTTAARAKAVAGLGEVARAALEAAQARALGDEAPEFYNVIALTSRRS
jgi:hypothetical protein